MRRSKVPFSLRYCIFDPVYTVTFSVPPKRPPQPITKSRPLIRLNSNFMPANLSTFHPKPAPFSPTPLARLRYETRTKRTDKTNAISCRQKVSTTPIMTTVAHHRLVSIALSDSSAAVKTIRPAPADCLWLPLSGSPAQVSPGAGPGLIVESQPKLIQQAHKRLAR